MDTDTPKEKNVMPGASVSRASIAANGATVYRVLVREVVEHTVYVHASSASEAREKARDDTNWWDDEGDWTRVRPVTVVGGAQSA